MKKRHQSNNYSVYIAKYCLNKYEQKDLTIQYVCERLVILNFKSELAHIPTLNLLTYFDLFGFKIYEIIKNDKKLEIIKKFIFVNFYKICIIVNFIYVLVLIF